MKVTCILRNWADPHGNGGSHRCYQIEKDFGSSPSVTSLTVFSLRQFKFDKPGWRVPMWRRRIVRQQQYARKFYLPKYIQDVVLRNRYFDVFVEDYEAHIQSAERPDVCVVDNPGLEAFMRVNTAHNIPTIMTSHNIESLGHHDFDVNRPQNTRQMMRDLAREIGTLAQANARLFISRVEAAYANGLGMPSSYYPYLPVDEIIDPFKKIREARQQATQEDGLLVFVGSVTHPPTAQSLKWLLDQIRVHGLPTGMRLAVVGGGSETILPEGTVPPANVDLLGWVSYEDLQALLARAQAVVVPHFSGFGALTRIPELAYTGVPLITSQHAASALHLPPGVVAVEQQWDAWEAALRNIDAIKSDTAAYDAWYEGQRAQVRAVIHHALEKVTG